MYTISFVQAEQALQAANAAVSIAEGHGCLCGAFCTLPHFSSASWLQELLPDPGDVMELGGVHEVDAALVAVHDQTDRALKDDAMSFVPLLPDDATPMLERIAALAQWSQGFLYGFGLGAPGSPTQYPGEVAEVLKDLSEIARASDSASDSEASGGDDDEQAYAELVEYLRAAVQLIHDEFASRRAELAQQLPH